MSEGFLEIQREGDLLWVTLNDPARANALSPALIGELIGLYRRPWREEGVRARSQRSNVAAGSGRAR